MLFNTWQYFAFLAAVFVLYFSLPHKVRWVLLLAASYFFYGCWNVRYSLLMLFSTAVTFGTGVLIDRENHREAPNIARKKLWVALCLTLNLLVLMFFKYYGFLTDSLQALLDQASVAVHLPDFSVLLPVGISFYTFQAIGYTIDVYRGTTKCSHHFGKYALFVSFFPQLVAGPIERSDNLLPQFDEVHKFNYENARDGLVQIMFGIFKKTVIADRLAILVNTVYNSPQTQTGNALTIATIFFAFQVYCDFSGYSDIAIGSAKMMGFRLMKNFDSPYMSTSIREFWRRWHVSLSSWFRDYLYFPLGGNRVKPALWARNILIVFCLSGLWHGANWTFFLWGLLHGVYQVVGKWTQNLRKRALAFLGVVYDGRVHRLFAILTNFVLVCFAWIFFRANSISDAFLIIGKIFQKTSAKAFRVRQMGMSWHDLYASIIVIFLLLVFDFIQWKQVDCVKSLTKTPTLLRYAIYTGIIFTIILFGYYGSQNAVEFIYFQF